MSLGSKRRKKNKFPVFGVINIAKKADTLSSDTTDLRLLCRLRVRC